MISSRLQIKYFFKDNSVHSINAFTRNEAEKQLLKLISRVSEIKQIPVVIRSEIPKEGSWADILNISAPYATNIITCLATYFLTRKSGDEKDLQRLQVESQTINNERDSIALFKDKESVIKASQFYIEMNKNRDIIKVGFFDKESKVDFIVERKDFDKYIIDMTDEEIFHENACIEVISPVLLKCKGNSSWSGIYKEKNIRFKMNDFMFKENVYNGLYSFNSGTTILCNLRETITYDDEGNVKNKLFNAEKVINIASNKINFANITESSKKIEKIIEEQKDLFS